MRADILKRMNMLWDQCEKCTFRKEYMTKVKRGNTSRLDQHCLHHCPIGYMYKQCGKELEGGRSA
jgi:hypothetical protein